MFVGHLAVAFAAKSARPRTSLGWFMAATTTLDLLWPIFLLVGVEHVRVVPGAMAFTPLVFDCYPWSHSLAMASVWGLVLAGVARLLRVESKATWLIVLVVVSHWILDFATHAPDMPLWPPNSPRLGLGLWGSIPGTLAIEGAMWVAALGLYRRTRRPRGVGGHVALWSFVLLCTVMWAAGPWSPPPPDDHALAWFALIGWLIVPWAVWIERTSVSRS